MSRKRAMFPNTYGSGCDGNKGNLNCIREFEEKPRTSYTPLSKSKLLITLLNDVSNSIAISTDATRRVENHANKIREISLTNIPLIETFIGFTERYYAINTAEIKK